MEGALYSNPDWSNSVLLGALCCLPHLLLLGRKLFKQKT
jgi:hypothetical protein